MISHFYKTFTTASARKHCLFSTFFSCFFFILLNNIIASLPQSIHTRKVKTILTRVTVKAVARNSRKLWKKKRMKRMARTVAYITSVLLLCNSILIAISLADIVIVILALSVIPTSRDCDIPQFIPKRISLLLPMKRHRGKIWLVVK